jgi:hypothetical protein
MIYFYFQECGAKTSVFACQVQHERSLVHGGAQYASVNSIAYILFVWVSVRTAR